MHRGIVRLPEDGSESEARAAWISQEPWGEAIYGNGSVFVLESHPNHGSNLRDNDRNLVCEQRYYRTGEGRFYYCYQACCGAVLGTPTIRGEESIRILSEEGNSPFKSSYLDVLVANLISVTAEEFEANKRGHGTAHSQSAFICF